MVVSFSCDSRDVIRVCEPCQGFVRRCKRCRRFHLVYQGQGGEYSMPLVGLRGVAVLVCVAGKEDGVDAVVDGVPDKLVVGGEEVEESGGHAGIGVRPAVVLDADVEV